MTAPRFAVLSLLAIALPAHGAEPTAELKVATPGGPPAVAVTGVEKAHLAALAAAKLTADEWPKVARLVVDEGDAGEVAKRQPLPARGQQRSASCGSSRCSRWCPGRSTACS
jgi:hypothetical protein